MSSDGAKLVRAGWKGDDAKVKRLLKAKVDVNSTATVGGMLFTALQQACCTGHVGAAQLLLKAKATVEAAQRGILHGLDLEAVGALAVVGAVPPEGVDERVEDGERYDVPDRVGVDHT